MNLNEWVNTYINEISEDEKDPQEITVGNYQTKYFHVCPGASTLYKDIESKGVDMDMAERSARLQDALYFVEEHIQRDGYEPEKDYVMVANNIAKNIMKMAKMMGLEKEHDYIQGHVDTIEKVVKEKGLEESIMNLTEKNVPTDPSKWAYYKAQAKKKFDVYPSAYANAWAAKKYKAAGGGWRKSESVNEKYTGNPGDKLTHKYDKNTEIELIEPTNRGWKVYQTTKGKRKVAYFDKQDIVGDKALFESVNEGDVTKKINRRGDEDGLLVKHNGEEYHIVYSGDFDMGSAVQPYGIVMPGDDTVSFLGKDKKAKQIWKQLKPKVDKFFKTNEATPEEEDEFHTKLDKLVHKTFGHSSDEEKMNEAKDMTFTDYLKVLDSKFLDGMKAVRGDNGSDAAITPTRGDILQNFTLFRNYISSLTKKYKGDKTKLRFLTETVREYELVINESVVNEAKEPEVITQLRKIVKDSQNDLIKDPKSGKKMRVDLTSASAVTQVYDALKQQSNKDKFVSMGLVGMVNTAFKLINKQEIVEYDVETLEELNDFNQFMKEYKSPLTEAEYQGRKVELGKIMQGDVKKFKVYVKNDKGNVVKVNFGQKGMVIKKDNPDARKSFRARHNCDNPGPRWKARYWSCRKW